MITPIKDFNKLRTIKHITLFSFLPFLLAACNQERPEIADIAPTENVSQSPYDDISLFPARTGWSPGLVFKGKVNSSEIIVDEIYCSNAFPSIIPVEEEIALTKTEKISEYSFNISFTPLVPFHRAFDGLSSL